MCTVTFLPRPRGYALAMNRDEQLTRVPGLPPAKFTINGRIVLAPSEPAGGTWIGVNDHGVTLALINWYSVAARVQGEARSRGLVVGATGAASTPEQVAAELAGLPLERIKPYRLIGVFPTAKVIAEWRWDLKQLVRRDHPWQPQQWISSGFDELAAQRVRGQTFRRARQQKSAGTLDWLRRLHRSHAPQAGPFSTCMHRADAATVSYTEVSVSSTQAVLGYQDAAPCKLRPRSVHHLERKF